MNRSEDYFKQVHKAMMDFHRSEQQLKPLYMLIKVEVDKDIVDNQDKAEAYVENHCNNLEYALCDWYYPDEPQYPYIAK